MIKHAMLNRMWMQVDSAAGTLAANFWWEGAVARQLGGHMDRWVGCLWCIDLDGKLALLKLECNPIASPLCTPSYACRYYARRLLQSLMEKEKAASLAATPRCDLLQAAAELRGQGEAPGREQPTDEQAAAVELLAAAAAAHQQAGPEARPPALIATVVGTLAARSPRALLDALLQLRRRQPQVAAWLLLHGLDAIGWELLSGCMERLQEELAAAGGWGAGAGGAGRRSGHANAASHVEWQKLLPPRSHWP